MTVFISYSHDSDEHRARVRHLADKLRANGINARSDHDSEHPSEGFSFWMDTQIRTAEVILIVCSATYRRKIEDRDEAGGVLFEGRFIYQLLSEPRPYEKLIPILLPGASRADIPRGLQDGRFYDLTTDVEYDKLCAWLASRQSTATASPVLRPASGPATPELRIEFGDKKRITAVDDTGVRVDGELQLDSLRRATIAVVEKWIDTRREVADYSRQELMVLGGHLYESVFNAQIEKAFNAALGRARPRQPLRLQLSFSPAATELAALPWEYLHRVDEPRWFATSGNIVLSRHIPLRIDQAPAPATEEPLRILIVVSTPEDRARGDIAVDSDSVIDGIRRLSELLPVSLEVRHRPSRDSLPDILDEIRPHVLHLIGHRQLSPTDFHGEVALFDPLTEGTDWCPAEDFAESVCRAECRPAVVFLHLRHDGARQLASPVASIATHLVLRNIAAVVEMQHALPDSVSAVFSRTFYERLADGAYVDDAVKDGRLKLAKSPGYDHRAFGTPALYLQHRIGVVRPPAIAAHSTGIDARAGRDVAGKLRGLDRPPESTQAVGATRLGVELPSARPMRAEER